MPDSKKIDIKEYSKNFPIKKYYVKGKSGCMKVPSRMIELSPTMSKGKILVNNMPVYVYDTTGLYTDPNLHHRCRQRTETIRTAWIKTVAILFHLNEIPQLHLRIHQSLDINP